MLDKLIESEVSARVQLLAAIPPLVYAVWIPKIGWLRDPKTKRMFVDPRIEVAQTAAKLYGNRSVVYPCDLPAREADMQGALGELEELFLKQEQNKIAQSLHTRLRRWIKWAKE